MSEFLFCDPLEDKIVYIIQSGRSVTDLFEFLDTYLIYWKLNINDLIRVDNFVK
jgi:hypothetical protein